MEGRGVSVQFCLRVLLGLGDSVWRGNWRILLSRADPLPGADIMVIWQLRDNRSCRDLSGDKKKGGVVAVVETVGRRRPERHQSLKP